MGVCALALGLLCVTGLVQLWHVYALAFLLGCATAFDAPARHTFMADLVGDADLPNAVALNSTSFNAGRLIGPAIAGVLIAAVGFGLGLPHQRGLLRGVLGSLVALRAGELHREATGPACAPGSLAEGLRYVRQAPDLRAVLLMLFLFGTFGFNFPIFMPTMSVSAFHMRRRPVRPARRSWRSGRSLARCWRPPGGKPASPPLCSVAATFGLGLALAALMPSYALFCAALVHRRRVRAELHHDGDSRRNWRPSRRCAGA